MKVIAINGSPRKDGNTFHALTLMQEELAKEAIETEILQVGSLDIRGCAACGYCRTSSGNKCCYHDDIVNQASAKMRAADGFILGSPTYYAGIAGTMKCFLDRVFFSSTAYFQYKVGTSVTSVRRAGGVSTVQELNNYLNLAQMIIPPSQYWTIAFGMEKGEVQGDGEGMQTLRRNAQAFAWVLKLIDAGKGKIPLPESSERIRTNFIR